MNLDLFPLGWVHFVASLAALAVGSRRKRALDWERPLFFISLVIRFAEVEIQARQNLGSLDSHRVQLIGIQAQRPRIVGAICAVSTGLVIVAEENQSRMRKRLCSRLATPKSQAGRSLSPRHESAALPALVRTSARRAAPARAVSSWIG